jgi:hypothetical protein
MITKRSRAGGRRGFYPWRAAALALALAVAGVLVSAVRLSAVRAATIQVAAGGDFQAALNAAQPGDTIVLAAGATFVGPFTLPYKVGSGTDADWITIRSDSALPPAGQRITPEYSPALPKLVSPGANQSALYTQPRAHHYRFVGVEFSPINSSAVVDPLVNLGNEGAEQDTLEEVPHHLVLDRCYVYAFPSQSLKRGVRLNSAHADILNSYIAGFKLVGQDSQAVMGSNGPGPFRVINNYLEGAGENLMFGGADPTIPNLVPSDIEIRRNYFSKPLSWREGDPSYAGTHWTVKNLLELKNAQRVSIYGNLFEHNWLDAQVGYAILFTVRNQGGNAPWSVVQDVDFTNNVVRHSGSGIQILGTDYLHPSQQTKSILVWNNLFDDIDGGRWGGAGHFLGISDGVGGVFRVDNNTVFHTGSLIQVGGTPSTSFVFTDNIARHNQYGVKGDGQGSGNGTLNTYFPGHTFRRNLIAGASPSQYPADNYYPPASDFDAQFVNRAGGDYHLVTTSPGYRGATNGENVGVDIEFLMLGTAGAFTGNWEQTPFWGVPAAIPGTVQAEDFDNGGEGIGYHDTSSGNVVGAYRYTDVDIEATGDAAGAYNVGWAVAGEWLEYTVNAASAGTYTVEARVASQVGQVVVDAENSHASIARGGQQWAVYRNGSRPAGSVCGGAMVSEPDSGVQIDAGYATTAPERQYRIQFTAPGTYYVWLRAWAANTNNNSVNVGLDGQPTTTADRISVGTLNAWTWVRGTMDGPVATLVVPTAGQHTVNVWMREDGMWIDRMLLTTSSTFVPGGQGPPESSR